MARVFDAIQNRLGTLRGNDITQARRLVTAIDQAQRIAQRISTTTGRLPYRGEVPALPGTTGSDSGQMTYTTIVIAPDGITGRESTTPVVFTSDRVLSLSEVQAQALATLGRGEVADQYKSRVPGLERNADLEVRLISVYRGTLHVRSR